MICSTIENDMIWDMIWGMRYKISDMICSMRCLKNNKWFWYTSKYLTKDKRKIWRKIEYLIGDIMLKYSICIGVYTVYIKPSQVEACRNMTVFCAHVCSAVAVSAQGPGWHWSLEWLDLRVSSAMPGPWIYFKENGDFFSDFKVEKGEYYECHQYDPDKQPQGFALWQVKSLIEANKDGIWVSARLVAVCDSHLHWWVTNGPGKNENRRFSLHLCAKDFAQCRRGRGRGTMEFHTDHFRVLSAHDVSDLRVSWFKEREAKEDMKLEVKKLMGKEGEAPKRGSRKRPLAESSSENEERDLPTAVEHPEGSGAVAEDLKKLRSEVDKDKKREDDKREAPRRRRERPRHEERGVEKEKDKEKDKKARQKAPREGQLVWRKSRTSAQRQWIPWYQQWWYTT